MPPLPQRCMSLTVGCILGATGLLDSVAATEWQQPQPFRREALEGRQFSYNAESFLHRLSFEAQPRLLLRRQLRGNGIEGTAGSTRGAELYVRTHVRLRADLDQRWFAEASHRRSEDFDGRYDTLLTGAGLRHQGWETAVLADVEGAKENIDMHLRLGWRDDADRHHIMLSLVGSDVPFNDKQDGGRYERQPYTMHVYGETRPWEPLTLRGFINYNAPMRLDYTESGLRSDDEGIAAGLRANLLLGEHWHAGISAEGRYRLRQSWLHDPPADASDPEHAPQRLRRSHFLVNAELGQQHLDGSNSWVGARTFYLSEDDRRPADDPRAQHITRQEYTLYGGHRRHLHGHWYVAPSIFLAYHDNELERPQVDADDDDMDARERHVGFYGKFSPTFEYQVLEDRQGVISFILHMRLHRAAFGGGNIQVYLPF